MTAGQGGLTGWRFNETLLQDLPPEIETEVLSTNYKNDSRLERLKILAKVEYNGTSVECLILSTTNGSILGSESATLTVLGNVVNSLMRMSDINVFLTEMCQSVMTIICLCIHCCYFPVAYFICAHACACHFCP